MYAPKSPPLRVLLGVLIIDAVVSTVVLAWNVGETVLRELRQR